MKKKVLICIITIQIILIGILGYRALYVFPSKMLLPSPPRASSLFIQPQEEKKWKEYMQKVGKEHAYTEFKNIYRTQTIATQHRAAHMMGTLLYKTNGVYGIIQCDDFGSNGCYHGLFGEAIQVEGISKVKEMDQACIEIYGPYKTECQHGIGHGLMVYFDTNVKKALDICHSLTFKGKLSGCNTGVFMEYNMRNVTHDENPQPRSLDPLKPYEPCVSLPSVYQRGCYYPQVEWWDTVYEHDYKKIGSLCDALEGDNRTYCFFGAGITAADSSNFHIATTLQKCDHIASSYGNVVCKGAATYQYTIFNQPEENTDKICNTVPQAFYPECIRFSKLF